MSNIHGLGGGGGSNRRRGGGGSDGRPSLGSETSDCKS